MGEILSFPKVPRHHPTKPGVMAESRKMVVADQEGDMRARTIHHVTNLPKESLLVAYRVAKLLKLNNPAAHWWNDLLVTMDGLAVQQVIELGKAANLFAQGYVLNWHGNQMKFNPAVPARAHKPARKKGKEAVV